MLRQSRFPVGTAAFSAGAGALATWLALSYFGSPGVAPDVPVSNDSSERAAPAAIAERSSDANPRPAAAPLEEQTDLRAETLERIDTPRATATRNPIVADSPPSNSPLTPTELPNRRSNDPSASDAAATLLGFPRITCDFGAGNNTGLRFGEVLTVGGGAQWNGGPLIYVLTDAAAGTAVLTGTPGVTGSPDGETKVQVTTEGTRVFLSGFQQDRAFVVVTIFDEIDNVGRHIAVMSRHDASFSFASQFLGTCE